MIIEKCPICSSDRKQYFRATLLHKYDIPYLFCTTCGLLQTESPYWLDEAYSDAIAITDTGLVSRNISICNEVSNILYFLFDSKVKCVDIAGGTGLLVRMMRDVGFEFYWEDQYCTNIHARGFEAVDEHFPVNIVTAFEVLEHISDPLLFIKSSLKKYGASTMIFSTELFEGNPPKPSDWWYYSLTTGQHISFYQYKTLLYLARKIGLNLYSHGSFHMLTNQLINPFVFKVLTSRFSNVCFKRVKAKLTSRTFSDHEQLTNNEEK